MFVGHDRTVQDILHLVHKISVLFLCLGIYFGLSFVQCSVSQRMSWALFGLVELYKMYTIDGLVGAVLHTVRCKVHIEGVYASL